MGLVSVGYEQLRGFFEYYSMGSRPPLYSGLLFRTYTCPSSRRRASHRTPRQACFVTVSIRFKSETVLIQLLIIVFPKVTLWATEVSSWPRSFLGATGTCPNCSHFEPTRLPRVRKDVSTDLLPDNRSDQTTNCCKAN